MQFLKKEKRKELDTFDKDTENQKHIGYNQAQLSNVIPYGKCIGVQTGNANQKQYDSYSKCHSFRCLRFHKHYGGCTIINVCLPQSVS